MFGCIMCITERSARGDCAQDLIKNIPLTNLLLETDAPYFPPTGSKISQPWTVIQVAQAVADIKEIPIDTVIHQCYINTIKGYNL